MTICNNLSTAQESKQTSNRRQQNLVHYRAVRRPNRRLEACVRRRSSELQQGLRALQRYSTCSAHLQDRKVCLLRGFRREVYENCAVPGYCAPSAGNSVPTFRDNLSDQSSGVKTSKDKRTVRYIF